MSTEKRAPTASTESGSEGDSRSFADYPLLTSITKSSEATEEAMTQTISNPSADDTTDGDTEYTGLEPIDFVLALSTDEAKRWVVTRLARYQEAVVTFATICQASLEGEKKTVSAAEWEATVATDGLTRAVPNEQHIYKWLLERDDRREYPMMFVAGPYHQQVCVPRLVRGEPCNCGAECCEEKK